MAGCFEHLARDRIWLLPDGPWPKEGFNGDGAVVSYLDDKETTMTLTAIALAAFALSSTFAFIHTVTARTSGLIPSMLRRQSSCIRTRVRHDRSMHR